GGGLRRAHEGCTLGPVAAPLAGSPLGGSGGLVGWRTRGTPDGGQCGEAVDGRAVALAGASVRDGRLVGAIRFPGSDATFGLVLHSSWRDDHLSVVAPDGLLVGR